MSLYIDNLKIPTQHDIPTNYWNLLDGTEDFKNAIYKFGGSIKNDETDPNSNKVFFKDSAWNFPSISYNIEPDQIYTFSYWVKFDKTTYGKMIMYENDNYKIIDNGLLSDLTKIKPNTWIKNAIVFKALKATSLQFGLAPSANVGTHVGSYMLSKGSIVLDWNYSLNDIKSKLGGVIRHLSAYFYSLVTSAKEAA